MASKTYEIAYKLSSQMSGSFSKTFSTAQKTMSEFNAQLNNMNQNAARVDKIIRLRQEVATSAQAFTKSKQSVEALAQKFTQSQQKTERLRLEFQKSKDETEKLQNVIKATKNPSDELTRAFENSRIKTSMLSTALNEAENETRQLGSELEKERKAVSEASASLDRKRNALKEVEAAAGTTGQSLKTLIQRHEEIAASADKARIAQEKMARATELQGKFKDMATSGAVGLATTAAAAAPLVLTVKAAMDFEDMQAELGKYSDDAAGIFKGIEQLTTKYSKSAADMTAMAANAMQTGIAKTREEVLELVESQTQAAVAFGMTGDAVGSAWADIQSKMGTSVAQTKAVFDIVNKLGNETSASSEDILNVLQRQGGTVKSLTAMNEKQIAALAGAFRSASTSSEVAATSMGTFISRLTVGSTATKAQQEAFEALGLDAEDVAKKMTSSAESAQATIQDVFARINKLSPDKRGAIIGQLFGNEAGIKAAVATLASQGNLLGNNLKMVANDANYAGSMFKEYAARANTTSEYMGILRNQVTLISARIGQAMLPAVKDITQSLVQSGEKLAAFIEKNPELVSTLLKVTGVVLGGAAAFNLIKMAIGFVAQPILTVYKGFQLYQKTVALANAATLAGEKLTIAQTIALKIHTAATKIASGAQTLWTAAKNGTLLTLIREKVALFANTIATKAHTLATNVATTAQTLWTAIKNSTILTLIREKIALVASTVATYATTAATYVATTAATLWAAATNFTTLSLIREKVALIASKVAMLVLQGVTWLVTAAQWAWNVALTANPIGVVIMAIAALIAIGVLLYKNWDVIVAKCKALWSTFASKFPALANFVKVPFEQIKIIFNVAKKNFQSVIDFVKNVFSGNWSAAWQNIKDIFANTWSGLVDLVRTPINAIIGLVNSAISAINGISVDIPDWVPGIGGGKLGFNIPQIPQLATGGIATGPTTAMIGEGAEPEAVLPLSKLDSMLSGGIQSGKGSGGESGTIVLNFSPTINVSGGSGDVAGDVRNGIQAGAKDLEKEIERILRNKRRLSYV